jgi:hypothetical protein
MPSDTRRLAIDLTVETLNGDINLWLPLSFRGLITSSTLAGETSFSESISNDGHLIENGSTTKIFVGDHTNTGDLEFDKNSGAPEGKGDTVALKTLHGQVRIRYVDDNTRFSLGGGGGGIASGGPGWLPSVLHPLLPVTTGADTLNAMSGMPGGPNRLQTPEKAQTAGFWGNWR